MLTVQWNEDPMPLQRLLDPSRSSLLPGKEAADKADPGGGVSAGTVVVLPPAAAEGRPHRGPRARGGAGRHEGRSRGSSVAAIIWEQGFYVHALSITCGKSCKQKLRRKL